MMYQKLIKEMPSIMHLPTCVSAFDKKKLYQYCKEIVKK